jgi:glycosyltransferase involved in cell wall biosynthesis
MTDQGNTRIIVGMPAYNEAKYVGSLIVSSKQYTANVLVVDDGSTDGTSKIAELAGAAVVKHKQNQGYGSTIQTIISEAKKRNADILVILDADAQHNPEDIPALIKGISEGYDVVIGSREMKKNAIAAYRRLGQRVLTKATSIASREKLSDTESGFRAYSKKAIYSLELKEKGMAISSEIISEANAKGLKITEVPISVEYTKDGSTLNPVKHGFSVLNRITYMISERRPLLFFGTVGIILFLIGLAAGITVIWSSYFGSRTLMVGTAMLSMLLISCGLLTIFAAIILNILTNRLDKYK